MSKGLAFFIPTKTVVVIGAIISFSALLFFPKWQVSNAKLTDEKRIELENANRATLVQGLGGLFVFATFYVTWRNLKIAEANLKATQEKQIIDAKVAEANLRVTEDKQITERFAKAVEMLGHSDIHVRLGAIYSLERISKDSDKDYWQIIEILSAYVREKSPYNHRNTNSIPIDVQAAITVLARNANFSENDNEYILDLSNSNLRGANLQRANFQCVNLSGTCLDGANLKGANLQLANLRLTSFYNANLQNANLREANLEVEWDGIFEPSAGRDENYIDQIYPDHHRVDLCKANLQGAILEKANLEGALLSGANLQNAILKNANLQYVDLDEEYEGSPHTGDYEKIFNYASLINADLDGADFRNAYITLGQIESAKNWNKAKYNSKICEELGLSNTDTISQNNL